ncbi:ATP-binding protein [Jidongwangia harbinensis]|uniref:ATP-binding protein n=1 Tax=Jidongwangia harbinensis TaxID=2878561 RepID=UPI001CD9494B|nr:ATP-binding protein [Jidongwangia harbinensis]MCA2214265.1 response regulator [Jidongwangia harbinensis]
MSPDDDLFRGGGAVGRLMAKLDWTRTPLGPVTGWSQSLRAAVRIVLSSRYPMLLLWGPEYTQLYNDAYSALIGDKHPDAVGGDVRITLAEGWDVLQPLIAEAMATGVASWVPALQLLLDRAGYREEAYFSVSHAPARDDDGRTVGVLTVCSEVTDQVVGERRLRLLRDLSVSDDSTTGVEQTCARLAEALGGARLDVPFAATYLRDSDGLRRVATAGLAADTLPATVPVVPGGPADWGLAAAADGAVVVLDDVAARVSLPGGPWDDPVRTVVAQPLPSAGRQQPLGVLVTGISPSRALDDGYRSFLQLAAQQVSVAVRNAQAYLEERRRAEALAALDQVKTSFFTNVSHEFRTPLTLLLGPLADALADRHEPLGPDQRDRVDTAWRNATRLLSLVNNLLTIASMEAGRPGHTPRDVDLARLTTDLAGVFRAAVERASLRLVVDCPPLPRPAAVDPANWEKIVSNLLSNALKFTFVGEIRVTLESDDTEVRLSVADTGIGIAEAELPRLFDRFHRVPDVRSRSHEGTGIGLALVRELARLHGGDVRVESHTGVGTTFTVALPWTAVEATGGPATGPAAVVPGDAAQAAAQEMLGWLDDAGPVPSPAPDGAPDARLLIADDNVDMRAYLTRLLTAQRWEVEAVADGEAALESIRRRRPDLLLTDVMMPRLDGFGLLRAVRQDESLRTLPVMMLSARAGREAGVEGLDAGADDYVVKPFAAPELIARIRTTLNLVRTRSAHTRQLSALADTAAVIASGRALDDAFQAATEQARALLDGIRADTVLDGGADRPPLRFRSREPDATETPVREVEAVLHGRHGRRIGALTVLTGPDGVPAEQARALLRPIAAMLAVLAESTWQLEHERQVTDAVRQSVLPATLPEIAGWDLAARRRPGPGGGFHDVLRLPGGDLLIAVGDAAGDGLAAAVAIGQIRNAVRAYAVADPAPARVLSRLVTLLDTGEPAAPATLLLARLDPAEGVLTWCSAGHPGPVLCAPDATAAPLPGPAGPPLDHGGATFAEQRIGLAPGARLLCHTGTGIPDLVDRCVEAARRAAGARDTVDAVLSGAADGVAVVAVHHRPAARPRPAAALADADERWVYPLIPTAASAMRRDLRAALGTGFDPDLRDDLLLAATEAVNNAVEHAQQPTRPEVEVTLRVSGGVVRIAVQDFGRWRERPPAMDRGRGALLMNAYGEVRVTTTSDGTLVTIERTP